VTAVEERGQAVLFVRALDNAAAVEGARVTLEGREAKTG
jgi:hypothetical protein